MTLILLLLLGCLEHLRSRRRREDLFSRDWCHRGLTFCWPSGVGWNQSSNPWICSVFWKRIPAFCRFPQRIVARRADAAPTKEKVRMMVNWQQQQHHQSLLYTFHNNGFWRFLPHQPFDQRFQLVSPETLSSLLWKEVWLHFLILWGPVIFQKTFYFPIAYTHTLKHWQFIFIKMLFHEMLRKLTKKSNGMFPGLLGRWDRITFSRSAELAALVPISTIKKLFCRKIQIV